MATAIYGDVPSAQLVTVQELDGPVWQIPCDVEVNVTFIFGGVRFPMNPLDTNAVLDGTDNDGNHMCYGAVSRFPACRVFVFSVPVLRPLTDRYSVHAVPAKHKRSK